MPKKKPLAADQLSIPVELIARRIYRIGGEKVMLDSDLAELYKGRGQFFEITICNLKRWPRRPALPALRLHRTRRGHAQIEISNLQTKSGRSQFS
jgi:hypothetical protein